MFLGSCLEALRLAVICPEVCIVIYFSIFFIVSLSYLSVGVSLYAERKFPLTTDVTAQ